MPSSYRCLTQPVRYLDLPLASRPQRRQHLVDLCWGDGPDDPRGALRWSLNKIRALVDTERPRVRADHETVTFDLAGVTIDHRKPLMLLSGKRPRICS